MHDAREEAEGASVQGQGNDAIPEVGVVVVLLDPEPARGAHENLMIEL
jgi:hypothetical protein